MACGPTYYIIDDDDYVSYPYPPVYSRSLPSSPSSKIKIVKVVKTKSKSKSKSAVKQSSPPPVKKQYVKKKNYGKKYSVKANLPKKSQANSFAFGGDGGEKKNIKKKK